MTITSFMFTETRQVSSIIDNIKNGNLTKVKNQITNHSVNRTLDSSGNTSLHYAIMFKKYDIIQYLLSIGADEMIENITGDNCRILACRYVTTEFFDAKTNEMTNLKDTISTQSGEIISLKNSITKWKDSYDKLNRKFITIDEKNMELKKDTNKLKRKYEYLEDSYEQLLKKNKN